MRYTFYLSFIFMTLLNFHPAIADVHLSVSESAIAVSGKSETDQSKGNLTSFISPGLTLLIQAIIKDRLKLNISGQITSAKFSAPLDRTLQENQITLKKYSAGLLYFLSENKEFNFDLGFQDFPLYYNLNQTNITLTKSNAAVLNSSIKQTLSLPFIFSYQISLQVISPIINDYDQGMPGFGYGIVLGKEILKNEYSYNIESFYNCQNLPMKNMLFKTEELGIRLKILIPIRSKTIL